MERTIMKLWKTILISLLTVTAAAAPVVVLAVFVPDKGNTVCGAMEFEVSDYDEYQFVNAAQVEAYLQGSGLNPVGKRRSDINLADIEQKVAEMVMVKDAVCYFDNNGNLRLSVTQRIPLFRVKTAAADYYIDIDRRHMPVSLRFTAYVPVVTGSVSEEFACGELYDFMEYIINDSRRASAFTQIHVYPDRKIELVPRVGDFIIKLGTTDRYAQKLRKLDIFLKKTPRYVAWDEYSVINLEYVDQVVCTRR